MSKKILIISGSPRKGGNSDVLCDQFAKGAKQNDNVVEKIYLRDKQIGFCNACYACEQSHECVQKDDMKVILEKMIEADVIVLSTPVYFYSMDGQIKTMIDRTLPRYTEIKSKDFYFIATAAEDKSEMKRTMEGLCGFTDCLPGSRVQGTIYGAGAWKKGEILGNPAMQEAYQFGLNV
jgi:multimeric flavodoxin WrbA